MTRTMRIMNIIGAVLMILAALLIMKVPEHGLLIITVILGVTMTIGGLRTLLYYLTMARFMVGGRSVLYRSIIMLDIGLLASSTADTTDLYVILYITGIHIVSGIIDVMRSREAYSLGSPTWKSAAAFGITNFLLAVVVVLCKLILGSTRICIYVYAAGLIYSAILRIVSALRRTAIVYIQ